MGRKMTQEEWLTKAKEKHGDKYDYSQAIYTGSGNYITIICKQHGAFCM